MIDIYDDTCIKCDSPNIMLHKEPNEVTYKCRECGAVWSSEDDYYSVP